MLAAQDWGTTSRASKIRRRDLLDLAHAVELEQDPALAVDLDQRLGLLGVDLLPAPDDVLGVVGAALGVGALHQPLHQLLGVDGQHHGGVSRLWPVKAIIPSSSSTWARVRG